MGRGEATMSVIKFFRKTSLTYQRIKTSHLLNTVESIQLITAKFTNNQI